MTPASTDTASSRVLVVDDDPTVRELFTEALELAGFEAVPAAGGQAALDLLERDGVEAVLLDSQMPGMDGLAVLRAIRGRPRLRTLPVILVTGAAEVADRVRGLEAGANDYLAKPVDVAELVARVRTQLRSQAAWMRLLEGQLRDRATVTEALCRLRPEHTPEVTADLICGEIARLRNLTGVALIAFTDDGGAVTLARHGHVARAVRTGLALPEVTAKSLRERAARGAWTEERVAQPPGATGPPLLGADAAVAAYAPLHSQGRLLGLLGLSSGPAADDAPTDAIAQALSAAIDFAAVSAALLGPGLRQRFELHTSQAELRRLLDGEGFTPVFQPIVDLATDRVVGDETLTRFADGVAPQRRFAEAARVGMGHAFERATMVAALLAATDLRDVWVSVNVSPGFLAAGGAEELPRPATCSLVLELTEHDPVEDYSEIRRAIERLDGVRLSIDDAGAGYACLTHVLTLGPAFIKLDRGWVVGIDADPARQALVAGLQSFAERTGATIIAEGIETEAELATLRELGVALGQGYLLGRPLPATALVASR